MSYSVNIGNSSGPTYVFTPAPSQTNVVRLQNIGSTPVWFGSFAQLSTLNAYGLPLMPGGKPLELVFPPSTAPSVYVSAGYVPGTAAATMGTGTGIATVGTTKLTVGTAMNVNFTPGSVLQLG